MATFGKSGLQVVRYGANQEETKAAEFLAYLRSLIPRQIDYRQVLLGVGVATFSIATGFSGYLLYQKFKLAKELQAKCLGIEISPGRHLYKGKASRGNEHNNTDTESSPPEGVVIVHQCPRGRRVPSIAPYPLKLETFLRVHGLRYEIDFNNDNETPFETPWVTIDLEDIVDSQNCIRYIIDKFNLDPDAHIGEKEKSIGRAYSHLLDNHLYWGIALWRWVYDSARHLKDIQLLPPTTLGIIPHVCRTVEQAAWFHGIGKKQPREVVGDILDDLHALSQFLGDKKYFLSEEKPSELDCTAFSLLAQMLWNMDGSPYHEAIIEDFQNLANFCYNMRKTYWPDWDLCLNNTPISDSESAGLIH